MELMDTSLDKFYKQVIDKGQTIPEDILGKIAVSVSTSRAPAPSKECGEVWASCVSVLSVLGSTAWTGVPIPSVCVDCTSV